MSNGKALRFPARNAGPLGPITMKKICKVKGKGKGAIEPEVWTAAMTKQFKNRKVKKVCLRLVKTPITIFKEMKLLNGNKLDKIAVSTIWIGAYSQRFLWTSAL